MSPTPYIELNQVLIDLVGRLEAVLGEDFIGAYLQGSFAVGGYDRHSDVDFIVSMERDLTSDQVEALQVVHDEVYQLESPWAQHLEGSYFPKEVLRRSSMSGSDLWYLDHGARKLIRSDHCNTILVRWIVRNKGVTLQGPPPDSFIDPISAELLQTEIFKTLNYWGQVILDDPAPFENWFYQTYIVLNFSRMLHDLTRGYPGSKREGAEWAKSVFHSKWHDLIDRAWDGRPDPAQKVQQIANQQDFKRTLEFLEIIMEKSRQFMAKGF